jgi:hypothetical protein
MLTANPSALRNTSSERDANPRQNSTSGGSSEREVNDEAVRPPNAPVGARLVMIVTPLVQRLRAVLKVLDAMGTKAP